MPGGIMPGGAMIGGGCGFENRLRTIGLGGFWYTAGSITSVLA